MLSFQAGHETKLTLFHVYVELLFFSLELLVFKRYKKILGRGLVLDLLPVLCSGSMPGGARENHMWYWKLKLGQADITRQAPSPLYYLSVSHFNF